VLQRSEGEGDGPLLAVLSLIEIGDRRAVLDAPGPVDRAGGRQQGLDQRRLS
jgi:hypothetical protein